MTENKHKEDHRHIQVQESVLRFIYQDDPALYWEFAIKKEEHEKKEVIHLNLQIPVENFWTVYQTFKLSTEDMERIIKWAKHNLHLKMVPNED